MELYPAPKSAIFTQDLFRIRGDDFPDDEPCPVCWGAKKVEAANNAVDILRWRRETGLSRAELARRLPVAYRTLEDWEAGRANPPKYLFRALRDVQRELKTP